MNALRSAILIVIVLLFAANISVWYYKTYESSNSVDGWGDWGSPEIVSEQPSPTQPAQPVQPPVVEQQSVAPSTPRTYGQALAAAKAAKKPLFIYFTSADCDYCTRMQQETLAQPQVQQALDPYVVYTLDVQGQDSYVAGLCNIRAVPYYLVVNAETRGVVKAGSGYKGVAVFLAWLN